MTSRELVRWSRLHEARAHPAWWTSAYVIVVVFGGALAGWVVARGSDPVAASHTWLKGTIAAFGFAFLRVPFLVYWRPDAPLLAQLPIEGRALFDAALVRCFTAAAMTTAIVLIGAIPLASFSLGFALRHVAFAIALGVAAACFLPAVAVWAASLVDRDIIATATALGGAPSTAPTTQGPPGTSSSGLMLGALPGVGATVVVVFALIISPWLVDHEAKLSATATLAGIAGASLLALLAVRTTAGALMGTILRDVSALDRQRLAPLEVRPPTGLERIIGQLTGDGALAYSKDARLMRRRYPMAYALGALGFLVLVIVGLSQPDEPLSWLIVVFGAATAYAFALVGRLRRPPIELPRLSRTLPITAAAQNRAKHAWLIGWWTVFVLVPGLFATLRHTDALVGLALVGGATLLALLGSVIRSRT